MTCPHVPKPLLLPLVLATAASVVAAHTACAPTGGATYERGTFAPPPPAPARPGVGAPTYDPQVKPLPPQPQPKPTRVLPQTPKTRGEPGIWAWDTPRASAEDGPVFAGILLPHPGSAEEYGVRDKILKCSTSLSDALDSTGITERVLRLKPENRYRCMTAHLFHACATFLNDLARARKDLPAQDLQEYATMLGIASTFLELECVDVDLTDEMILIRNDGGRKWTEHLKTHGFRKR